MPLTESGIEIEATLTIVGTSTGNEFVLDCDITPIPDLTEFHEIHLLTTSLICTFDPTTSGYVKKEYQHTANNTTLLSLVSCAGQWAEDYIWYFDFDESIYDQVKILLDEKSITYQLPNDLGMILVKLT
jgi:hypothetical protein